MCERVRWEGESEVYKSQPLIGVAVKPSGVNTAVISAALENFLALTSLVPARCSEMLSQDISWRRSVHRERSLSVRASGAAVVAASGVKGPDGDRIHLGPSPALQAELLDVSPLAALSALAAALRHFQREEITRRKAAL